MESRKKSQGREGFTVTSIQSRQTQEGRVREYEDQLLELRRQLEAVGKERDALQSNQERVSAQWEGKVRRLQNQLKTLQGGGGEEEVLEDTSAEIEESLQSRISELEAQVQSLSGDLVSQTEELQTSARLLKETKNMNAALENQLTEYMDALEHQNKSVQRSMAKTQANSAELKRAEQESVHMADYLRKQQLEYQEALQGLQKKVALFEEVQQENLRIHQLNVTLTGELEDYRNQTKTLLSDIVQKDREIARLQEARSQMGSSNRVQLELESMRQKCDAWREEVEKLTPLKDEVSRLSEENSELTQRMALLIEEKEGLSRNLQEMSAQHGQLESKFADCDVLMEQVSELQRVRLQLENELSPLRAERANILSENASLREASQTDKYIALKNNYMSLSENCVQLQKALSDECEITKKLEEANQQLQQQLREATNVKNLQTIRERMERYRLERDNSRETLVEVQKRVQENVQLREESVAELQRELQEASQRNAESQDRLESLANKIEATEKKMRRYREERNMVLTKNKALEEENASLQTILKSKEEGYDSYDSAWQSMSSIAPVVPKMPVQEHLTPSSEPSTSPPDDQLKAYSADDYADSASGRGYLTEPSKRLPKYASVESAITSTKYRTGRNTSPNTSGKMDVIVQQRDGDCKTMRVQRLLRKLNPRLKPEVVVKRKEGKFEMGTLMYLGVLDGKEMAGIELHLPTGPNDGSFKDGKFYFRTKTNHGLYCPYSNIFIEVDSDLV